MAEPRIKTIVKPLSSGSPSGSSKKAKGYQVTHPKGHTYFISNLNALIYTYGMNAEGLKQIGWKIQAVE